MVLKEGPPSSKITPKLVNVKRNTKIAALNNGGLSKGRVTEKNAFERDAPSTRAASDILGLSFAQ